MIDLLKIVHLPFNKHVGCLFATGAKIFFYGDYERKAFEKPVSVNLEMKLRPAFRTIIFFPFSLPGQGPMVYNYCVK